MPKTKSHKSLLRRVRITGTGKVKFRKTRTSHLMSHMSGDQIRKKRKATYAKAGDIKRLSRMLHRPLLRGDFTRPERSEDRARAEAATE